MLSLSGCGSPKGPKREAVSGTVTREGINIDTGSITFNPTAGGTAVVGNIVDGKYAFDETNGPIAGNQKVAIVQFPQREEVPPGTPKKDAAIIKETRFKKGMPTKGWEKTAEIKTGHKEPVDFHIDE